MEYKITSNLADDLRLSLAYARFIESAVLHKLLQYRPKLYNSQRAEKSLVIEDSLKMGIVPDFTEVFSREVQCQVSFFNVIIRLSLVIFICRNQTMTCYMCVSGVTQLSNAFNSRTRKTTVIQRGGLSLLADRQTVPPRSCVLKSCKKL